MGSVSNAYSYNRRRLLTEESMVPDAPQGAWSIGYGYDPLGHLVSETDPGNVTVNYSVNALGQTTGVTASVGGGAATPLASSVLYYPNGALRQFTYGNGIAHVMVQNARQLPARSTDGTVLNLETSYDRNGNVAAITDGKQGSESTFLIAHNARKPGSESTFKSATSIRFDVVFRGRWR
ncbi:MAG: hypothetical protein M9936_32905 [Caldilinea sp.]|nr:hypothetical protein [Caldilinea sp.]